MALEEKVQALETEVYELRQQVQKILALLIGETDPSTRVVEWQAHDDEVQKVDLPVATSEMPTRPLNPQNMLVRPEEYGLSSSEFQALLIEPLEDDEDTYEALIDFFPVPPANGTHVATEESAADVSENSEAQPIIKDALVQMEEDDPFSDLLEQWEDIDVDHWIDETYAQTDSCFKQFSFLFHWIEETVEYIGQEKMLRTLNLYNRHDYIPDKVYQLLRDVIQLLPKSRIAVGNTHEIINSLMELNGMLEGDIRIGMNELMEIVGQN